jgi:hypothetical protein
MLDIALHGHGKEQLAVGEAQNRFIAAYQR